MAKDTISKPASGRGSRGPMRSDAERIAALEAQLPAMRRRAEKQLLKAAWKAGLFDFAFTQPELRTLLEDALAQEPRALSRLHRRGKEIGRLRNRKAKRERADLARVKALLGGFMTAQFRHGPDLHAELAGDLRDHLAGHANPRMAASNIAFMAGILDDPRWEEGPADAIASGTGIAHEQQRRNRARRMILIGSWVLDRRGGAPDGVSGVIDRLIRDELANFLARERSAARNVALLEAALGPFRGRPDRRDEDKHRCPDI
ncbi:hypothetical protein [Nitratireductor sp. XY-223]|uniref:hypothetical protein n=1 Tax=Nitratireductor sp. XY-223 TaxID=2561926 RepID=UPI0010AAEAC0|nr:hypothetical protein [Nitratireductor sp. XY-223]